ncbi:DUF3868 domain-containing protein [Parabacteroides gordonii]|uniref:DUF3868 domain-containing protein n=1 Tax=Parabacteroides gordonii TaxID=574930 RepID=UPI0026EF0E32|nr:DUF3868 domain-containing protein [Parabacteroides gordonii]
MKHTILHYIYVLLAGVIFFPATLQGIRISPQELSVRNDSLQIFLEMDLNDVHVNNLTSVSFTLILQAMNKEATAVELPPVIITGSKRFRFERRERALASGKVSATPYLVLIDNHKTVSKNINYRISVPYASWMQNARLLLRQEVKDCCDLQLLGIDTLVQHIALKGFPEHNLKHSPEHSPVPVLDTGSQENSPLPAAKVVKKSTNTVYAAPCQARERDSDTESLVLYFDYPIGKDDIHPDLKNNRYEIDKIDRLFAPLRRERFVSVRSIRVCGYSSPDGNYGNNERLAEARSRFFSIYLRSVYGIPRGLVEVSSVAEDWEGLVDLLERDNPPYREAVLRVISRYGIFNGREKYLMELQGGVPYKDMLRHFFPRLRRIEVIVRYEDDKTENE